MFLSRHRVDFILTLVDPARYRRGRPAQ